MTDLGGGRKMKVKKIKKDGWVGKEVHIVKPYKRFSNFKRAVRQAVLEVFGFEDILTVVVSSDDIGYRKVDGTVQMLSLPMEAIKKFKKMGAVTIEELIDEFGEVSFSWGGEDWKQGIDVKFDEMLSRIYVYDMWKE